MKRIRDCAALINSCYSGYSILDVGCRSKDLKKYLDDCISYQGLDMEDGPDVLGCDLEQGIPFDDETFDIVVALDVIEHLDNAHFLVREMRRVAKSAIFISLPNMYYVTFRWNFLSGRGISGKYPFPPEKPADRHKWIPSYTNAIEFVEHLCAGEKVEVHKVMPERGRLRSLAPLEAKLAERFPNLLVYGALFHVQKAA